MSNIFLAAILWLLPAPSPKWNETPEAFHARMSLIADSVDQAVQFAKPADRKQLGLAVVVKFWGESRFAPLVHSGAKLGDGGRAICMGQHQRNRLSENEWRSLGGADLNSTTRCAELTAKRLKAAFWYCYERDHKYGWTNAFTLYGTGRSCRPEDSKWKNIFLDRGQKLATLSRNL